MACNSVRNVAIYRIILVAAALPIRNIKRIKVAIWAGNIRAMNSLGPRVLASDRVSQKTRTTRRRYSGRFECARPWGISMQLQLQQSVNASASCAPHGWLIATVSTASPAEISLADGYVSAGYEHSGCSSYTDSWINPRSVRRCNFACRTWVHWV